MGCLIPADSVYWGLFSATSVSHSPNPEFSEGRRISMLGVSPPIPEIQAQVGQEAAFQASEPVDAGDAYLLHWDSDFSRRHGLPNVNTAGCMFGDYLTEMLVRWMKDPGSVKSLNYANRAMAFPGDTLVCRGKIRTPYEEAGKRHAVCRVWVENQKRQMLVEGSATVIWA